MPKPVPVTANASSVLINERLRISSILESPEGIARPKAAMQLALRSTMDSQSAIDLLKSFPVANPYIAAMDLEGAINVNSLGANPAASDDKKARRIAEINANIAPAKKKA
jgi:hypothetical protein